MTYWNDDEIIQESKENIRIIKFIKGVFIGVFLVIIVAVSVLIYIS